MRSPIPASRANAPGRGVGRRAGHVRRARGDGRSHPHGHRSALPQPSARGGARGREAPRGGAGGARRGGRGREHRSLGGDARGTTRCRAADRARGGRGPVQPKIARPGRLRPDGAGAQTGALAMSAPHPIQEFFSIGEVCQLTDLKPHVLRYWESQFRFLNPAKNRSGNRVYQRREIELIMLVKHLLYTEKYTIEGARQKIEQYRRSGELKPEARRALATGIARALADGARIVVTLDADGQHAPAELPRLLAPLARGEADLVLGARARTAPMPRRRRCSNWLSAALASRIGGQPIADAQTGFRAFSRAVAQAAAPPGSRLDFETAFLLQALPRGLRVRSVPESTIYQAESSNFRSWAASWRVARGF